MNSIKQEAREARFKKFVKEFVNDHGENWRPLRGLWPEDVAEFWEKYIDRSYSQGVADERKRVLGIIIMHADEAQEKQFEIAYHLRAIATEIERGDD
jgi:hypothetical protein